MPNLWQLLAASHHLHDRCETKKLLPEGNGVRGPFLILFQTALHYFDGSHSCIPFIHLHCLLNTISSSNLSAIFFPLFALFIFLLLYSFFKSFPFIRLDYSSLMLTIFCWSWLSSSRVSSFRELRLWGRRGGGQQKEKSW